MSGTVSFWVPIVKAAEPTTVPFASRPTGPAETVAATGVPPQTTAVVVRLATAAAVVPHWVR